MKVKKYLSVWAMVCAGALTLAGCSDYDNGYTENAIKFQEEFRKAYGDIDPEQDWNLAERASVTVNTQKESNIKIYALRGSEYTLVGDYKGVNGTQMLGVDLVEGTRHLIVSDGSTAQQCTPGDVVVFNAMSTRAAHTGTTNGVTVSKITNDNGLTLDDNGVIYPKYKYATKDDYDAMTEVIPEINIPWTDMNSKNPRIHTNLPKVTHDFTYVSTGSFIVYPYYWETSSDNEIGLYYQDGEDIKYVPIYTIKSGDEFQYHEISQSYTDNGFSLANATNTGNAQLYKDNSSFTWTETSYNFVENLGLPNGNLLSRFTDLTLDVTMKKWTPAMRVVFYKSDNTNKYVNIVNPSPSENGDQRVTETINLQDLVNQDPSWRDYLENCSKVSLAGYSWQDYSENKTFKAPNSTTVIGDVVLNDVYFSYHFEGSWKNYSQNFCSEIYSNNLGTMVRGQGILVNIEAGKVFGMYLKKNGTGQIFYSQSELNDPAKVGKGIVDDGVNLIQESNALYPCFASTFHVGDQMFLGFEDWPNNGDFDLNDVVLAFDGCKPTIINEDPTPGGTWLLVCEDLGGSFDTDYNDVIFKVEHISGQEFLNVTAMAAGGTLASYIVFNDPTQGGTTQGWVAGEIHEMFNVGREISGAYEPINAKESRWEKTGTTVTIPVHKNWQIAYNVDAQEYKYDDMVGKDGVNMGGFRIYTLPSGTEITSRSPSLDELVGAKASVIAAPGKGDAPYILCLPYSYTKINDAGTERETFVWAWPLELCTICETTTVYNNGGKYNQQGGGGAYPDFATWVGDYTTNKDWYKKKNGNGATVEDWRIKYEDTSQGVSINEEDENKLEANFGTWAQYAYGDWANVWSFTREGKKIAFYTGDKIEIHMDNYSGDQATRNATITTVFEDNYQGKGLTGTTCTQNGNVCTVAFGPNAGTTVLRIHYSGNDDYKPADILLVLQVKAAEIARFRCADSQGNYQALAYVDGNLKLKGSSQTDAYQQWRLEDTGDGLFLMMNMGTRKYLRVKAEEDGHGIFETAFYNDIKANAYYRFAFSNNLLRVRQYNRNGHELNLSFGTDENPGSGVTVFLDKGGNRGGNVITWMKATCSFDDWK